MIAAKRSVLERTRMCMRTRMYIGTGPWSGSNVSRINWPVGVSYVSEARLYVGTLFLWLYTVRVHRVGGHRLGVTRTHGSLLLLKSEQQVKHGLHVTCTVGSTITVAFSGLFPPRRSVHGSVSRSLWSSLLKGKAGT